MPPGSCPCRCTSCSRAEPPGFSNHQRGRALDLNTAEEGVLAWLDSQAAVYGFQRTEADEDWHWEWDGVTSGEGPCDLLSRSGSYLETCAGCVIEGGALTCYCDDGQEMVLSALSLVCSQDIANCSGELTCGPCLAEESTPSRANCSEEPTDGSCPAFPEGSYQWSCSGCKVSDRALTCTTCEDGSGHTKASSLPLPCLAGVSNCSGVLHCGDCTMPVGSSLPQGRYQNTCRTCRVINGNLTCDDCTDSAGLPVSSTLVLPCDDQILACNGRLTCGACPSIPVDSSGPDGSYRDTCPNCRVVSGRLDCDDCADVNGTPHQTSLSLPCTIDIANCNGGLVCGSCQPVAEEPKPSPVPDPSPGPPPTPPSTSSGFNGPVSSAPSGSFKDSCCTDEVCSDCIVVSGVLECGSCKNQKGEPQRSRLSLPCAGDIANCNGQLQCGGC